MNVALRNHPALNSNLTVSNFLKRLSTELVRQPIKLEDYFKASWPILEPNRDLVWNWHIPYVVEHLEAVTLGQIKRLIVNMHPRSLKSKLISVMWPTWTWTFKPWLRWIFASYAAALSVKHSTDRRNLIESPWYQKNWGSVCRMAPDQNMKTEYQNTQQGVMVATSVGGSITGKGGDILVIDDLINPEDAESKLKRDAALEFYRLTLSTRLDDKTAGAKVIVEQRLHTSDLTANALKEGGWTHIKLPMEAPAPTVYLFPRTGRVYERAQGELLNPARDTAETVAEAKMVSGSRGYAAQYQQEPVVKEGNFLKYEWWKFYNREAANGIEEQTSAWGWDIAAKTGQENDFTAGIRIAKVGNRYRVKRIINKRLEYPEMKRRVVLEYNAERADALVIEDASSGQAVIQDLRRETSLPIIAFQSTKDKVTRVNMVAPIVEAGLVELPEDDSLTAEFMDQCAAFPSGEHDDMVDCFVLALMQLSGKSGVGMAGLYVMAEESEDVDD